MHTNTWTDPDSGVEYRVHHNGDFSGEAFVCLPSRVGFNAVRYPIDQTGASEYCEITLPGRLLVELAERYVAGQMIATLEEKYG